MSAHRPSPFRQTSTAIRALLILTVMLGIGYPAVVFGVGAIAFPAQAGGSLIKIDGEVVGSRLIGQSFAGEEWFQSRPSAAGDGYDAAASSGSNFGPENADLITAIGERRSAIAEADGAAVGEIPADAVTASGSGLDPHISPAYALLQVERVADARSVTPEQVRGLVESHTQGRDLGFLGEPRVNVLELNIALAELGD